MYELWKKAGLKMANETPESSRALVARVAILEAKTNKSSKLTTEIINPSTEKRVASVRSVQILDGHGC